MLIRSMLLPYKLTCAVVLCQVVHVSALPPVLRSVHRPQKGQQGERASSMHVIFWLPLLTLQQWTTIYCWPTLTTATRLQGQGAGKTQGGADGAPKLVAKKDSGAADSKASQTVKASGSTESETKQEAGSDTGVKSPALTVPSYPRIPVVSTLPVPEGSLLHGEHAA